MEKSTERLKGYSIRVSNSSDVLAGSTDACFTDDRSSTLPTTIDQVCKVSARYVWFYQTHAYESTNGVPILEICEVQVFGKLTRIIYSKDNIHFYAFYISYMLFKEFI